MAPVSLPKYQSRTEPGSNEGGEPYATKKRASIHYPDDSTAAKRMSLHFGSRCRSLSESWAFSSASTVVPEFPEKKDGPSPSSTPSLSSPDIATSSSASAEEKKNTPDKDLMKTLASFLGGEGNGADRHQTAMDCRTTTGDESSAGTPTVGSAAPLTPSQSTFGESADNNLVVTIRDFAYPKTHPYHIGQYPPEPAYEESDIEEDTEMDDYDEQTPDDNGESDNTQGQARALYDFDAENSSELSFRDGEVLWIHCRQFPGWLLGEMEGKTGLVPENYVQLL
ncbi:HOG (high osmolarity glycerol) pathway protein [Dissophora globulifera]|uniref:HOG (High osmolarity glycerol) pathway protein n=1 Tax=Dissophora globulifera TaxID=979702 RepID=A0A9P6RFY2_9FUNG|nr:HOG (high osmolarity glycerol) pathway protein [Dissophora globulifera]